MSQKPDTKSLAHQRQEEATSICRDVYGGPLTVRKGGKKYLPAFPREEPDAYTDRLNTSVFYDAFGRTVGGLTGMVFRKPPELGDDVPAEIKTLWENIDMRGTHGDIFAQQRHTDGEVDGHFIIFVDMQRPPDGVRSRAAEKAVGLRPYWIGIRKQDVIGARSTAIEGRVMLTHFRYATLETERDGEYGEKEVPIIREYNLVTEEGRRVEFVVWEYSKDEKGAEDWRPRESGIMSIDEIPVSIGYLGERVGLLESAPPHLPLALENIKHYQLVSDNDNCLHIASVPWPAFIGVDPDEEIAIGPNMGVKLPMGADVKMVEPEGNGLAAMENRIQKSEHRMAILGLSMLMSESRAAETATSKRIDKSESDSELSNHARATQDALEEALRLTAKWLKLPSGGSVSMNMDFNSLPIDAQTIGALANLVSIGKLTQETMWKILQRGEVLPGDFDAEVEASLLEGVAAELAAQEAVAMQRMDEAA